ncbi:MAG: hypothetical protein Q9208_001277 [Pyrenodesmia sp. 3 TL-2023]
MLRHLLLPFLKTPHSRSPRLSARLSSTKTVPPHNSLSTFLTHARLNSLSPTSTVYIGTHYEYLCLQTLARLSFSLTRTGGRSDHGIDLVGHWHLPSLPYPLRVLVQCKALRAKPKPWVIRELEGMYAGAPSGWRNGERTVALLCAKREATKGVREALRGCGVPVVWVMVEDTGGQGRVRQVLWNAKVSELGAEGLGAGVKYMPSEMEGAGLEKEVVLTWKGEVWEPDLGKEEEGG